MSHFIHVVTTIFVLATLLSGCATPTPLVQKVEVTREVTREVRREVTRQVAKTVVVTLPVEVTRQVIITSAAPDQPTEVLTQAPPQLNETQLSAFLKGNEAPKLPAGEPGKISVIATAPFQGAIVPIAVRNNTTADVIRIKVTAVVYGKDGKMLATGGDQGLKPNLVKPGEIALGYIYFGDGDLPADVRFEFDATAEDPNGSFGKYENIRDLTVLEANAVGKRIVGFYQNQYDTKITGPISVTGFCFDEAGQLLSYMQTYADKDTAEPGEKIPFQLDAYKTCPVFLVTGSGYYME